MSASSDNQTKYSTVNLKGKSAGVTSPTSNSSTMEDELTCPVCLELFADPLLLPCSHSICKKCLQDIMDNRIKAGKDGLDCPSCRKSHPVNKSKVGKLPRNLALENIVFRYQEMQSQSLTKQKKSFDLTPDLQLPLATENVSQEIADSPVFFDESNENCGLCDENTSNKALWYCEQCCVAYCQNCLDNYHPKRGQLAHHRLRKPQKMESLDKQAFCVDHSAEVAAIFCDQCQLLVCHLCVCDGVGKHSQHKILSLDTAWNQTKETVTETKEKLEVMVSTLTEQSLKLEEVADDIEAVHSQACQKIELQFRRLIDDTTASLRQHRHQLLTDLADNKAVTISKIQKQLEENRQQSKTMENLMESCKKLLDEDHMKGLLGRAREVTPLTQRREAIADSLQSQKQQYQDLVSDKTTQQELKQSVGQFKSSAQSCLHTMLADDASRCQSIIPVIMSATSPGKEAPRVQNKCLTTWGFNSTSFTAEPLEHNSLWSVTIEKNSSHMGDIKNGYAFGVGIAWDKLNIKDQVGLSGMSHGIVCSGGNLVFSNNSKMEHLMPLDNLPLSITIYCTIDQSDGVILAYTFTDATWGDTLYGKKILIDHSQRREVFPVFTVSQRVKMQFPTYV